MKKRESQTLSDGSRFSLLRDACLTLFYPQSCRVCGGSVETKFDGVACAACWDRTKIFNGAEILCRKCGRFLQNEGTAAETFCHRCDEDFYDAARAVGLYEGALSAEILNLKHTPIVSLRLRKLLYHAFSNSEFTGATRVVPVPLSIKRFKERTFNQAALLAKDLAERANITLDEKSLTRRIHTEQHRAGMDEFARRESVRNAFAVTRPKLVAGEKILLVDDVFTSGATVSFCAEELKKNGAAKVYVLTVARAF